GESENVESIPEKRINSFWIGAIMIPACYVTFGWALENGVHISVPLIALFFGGFSINVVFTSALAYLGDAHPTHAAAMVLVSDSMSFIVSGIMTVVTSLLKSLGYGWLFTILAIASVCGMILSVVVYFKGRSWREGIFE
ncbi:10591_t:CDS:2, partial [Acaulospora morrowiae]